MTEPTPAAQLRLVLSADNGTGQLTVELEPFIAFNRWINGELEQLEKRFAQFRTPGQPAARVFHRPRKPK